MTNPDMNKVADMRGGVDCGNCERIRQGKPCTRCWARADRQSTNVRKGPVHILGVGFVGRSYWLHAPWEKRKGRR